ncbi:hypothetical protein ACK3TF_005281 [Chlorella vulgaris]
MNLLACVAACTAVLLELDQPVAQESSQWVDRSIVAAGLMSAGCGIGVYVRQLCFGSKAQHSKLSATLAATGAAAHLGMLVVISVFWSCFATRRYYKFHGTSEPTRQVVERQVNYFSYFHRWSDAEMALYIFGCAGGAAAWLLSLATAVLERRRAAAAATTEAAVEKLHSSLHESCCSMLLSPYRSQMLARALLHE